VTAADYEGCCTSFSDQCNLLAEWDACVLLDVTVHGQKGRCCPAQVQAYAFENENNFGY
jgi:hypothetical protein